MTRPTDELIASLAADTRAVKRLAPPGRRAAVWLALILGVGALAVARFADIPAFMARNASLAVGLGWTASLATGIAAVVAAAHLSLPDRPRRWALLPLPFLVLWLAASGAGCLDLPARPEGPSDHCLIFIVVIGGVLSGLLLWRLRRARPMDAGLTATMGALGAAGLAAALLAFFHPFAITWLDLGAHLVGVAVVLGLSAVAGHIARGR